jgi:hypothetical protein
MGSREAPHLRIGGLEMKLKNIADYEKVLSLPQGVIIFAPGQVLDIPFHGPRLPKELVLVEEVSAPEAESIERKKPGPKPKA